MGAGLWPAEQLVNFIVEEGVERGLEVALVFNVSAQREQAAAPPHEVTLGRCVCFVTLAVMLEAAWEVPFIDHCAYGPNAS